MNKQKVLGALVMTAMVFGTYAFTVNTASALVLQGQEVELCVKKNGYVEVIG